MEIVKNFVTCLIFRKLCKICLLFIWNDRKFLLRSRTFWGCDDEKFFSREFYGKFDCRTGGFPIYRAYIQWCTRLSWQQPREHARGCSLVRPLTMEHRSGGNWRACGRVRSPVYRARARNVGLVKRILREENKKKKAWNKLVTVSLFGKLFLLRVFFRCLSLRFAISVIVSAFACSSSKARLGRTIHANNGLTRLITEREQ